RDWYLVPDPARNGPCGVLLGRDVHPVLVYLEDFPASPRLHELDSDLPVLGYERLVKDANRPITLRHHQVLLLVGYHREILEIVLEERLEVPGPLDDVVALGEVKQLRVSVPHVGQERLERLDAEGRVWVRASDEVI